jgi:predicted phosphodiesterase
MPPFTRKLLTLGCCAMIAGGYWILRDRESTSAQSGKTDPAPVLKEKEAPFVVGPYLQFPTRDSITIMWETAMPGTSIVDYGESALLKEQVVGTNKQPDTMHEITLKGLKPNSRYLYRVTSVDTDGKKRVSDTLQFMTAVDEDSAFSFGIIGDTQKNPRMTGQIAKLIWERRPHFVVHLGDVVDNGPDKKEWTDELFGPCQELFSRVPVFPCIGNHEKNHAFYYKYFSLPDPEYHYRYRYGNADFFVVDSNKTLKPDSEQYKWLDAELGKSTAKWKICYHHHPAWTSDDNDYGDTTKNIARLGDLNVRNLVTLYEKQNVDLVMNGHIHLYERTWPLRNNKVSPKDGVIYITSGGGGGKLENFGPLPTWFKAQLRVDFHFCYVNVQGGHLEFKAFDQKGNLFDCFDLRK